MIGVIVYLEKKIKNKNKNMINNNKYMFVII